MKKPTLTIFIPAHNEEKNLANLVQQLLTQSIENYQLESITIANDGSTDKTATVAKSLIKTTSTLIKVVDDGKRLGKLGRLNQAFSLVRSDLLVVIDGDIQLVHKETISDVVASLSRKGVLLTSAKAKPLPPKNFIQKIIYYQELMWNDVISKIKFGNNIHNATGCLIGLTKDFYKNTMIPEKMIAEDHYLYLYCMQINGDFLLTNTPVYYKMPESYSDYVNQFSRYDNSADKIKKHFKELAAKEYCIPKKEKIRTYLKFFLANPLMLLASLSLKFFLQINEALKRDTDHSKNYWQLITSSK